MPDWHVRVEAAFSSVGRLERMPGLGDIVASLKLGWRLARRRYDVIFVQGAEYSWACRLSRWLTGSKSSLAIVWHGVGFLEARVSRPPRDVSAKAYALFRRFEQRFGLKADAIMAVHHRVIHDLETVYGFNGRVDVAMNALGSDVREELAAPRVESDGFVILWIGQVAYLKGLDIAIQASGLAREAIPELSLVAVGAAVHASDESWVRQLGPTSPVEVRKLLRSAQLIVMPSRYEGFPITLLEAMAAGLPIIASEAAAGGIIQSGINGLILSGFDPRSYADAIIKLWRDPSARAGMSQRNQDDICQFTWSKTAACYTEVALRLAGATIDRRFAR
jgi:glycosyltransferase involved in cell wall biosynthesis